MHLTLTFLCPETTITFCVLAFYCLVISPIVRLGRETVNVVSPF